MGWFGLLGRALGATVSPIMTATEANKGEDEQVARDHRQWEQEHHNDVHEPYPYAR